MMENFIEMAKKLIILLREEKLREGAWVFPTVLQVGDYTLSEEREADIKYLARVLQKLFDDMPNLGHCEFREMFTERTCDDLSAYMAPVCASCSKERADGRYVPSSDGKSLA